MCSLGQNRLELLEHGEGFKWGRGPEIREIKNKIRFRGEEEGDAHAVKGRDPHFSVKVLDGIQMQRHGGGKAHGGFERRSGWGERAKEAWEYTTEPVRGTERAEAETERRGVRRPSSLSKFHVQKLSTVGHLFGKRTGRAEVTNRSSSMEKSSKMFKTKTNWGRDSKREKMGYLGVKSKKKGRKKKPRTRKRGHKPSLHQPDAPGANKLDLLRQKVKLLEKRRKSREKRLSMSSRKQNLSRKQFNRSGLAGKLARTRGVSTLRKQMASGRKPRSPSFSAFTRLKLANQSSFFRRTGGTEKSVPSKRNAGRRRRRVGNVSIDKTSRRESHSPLVARPFRNFTKKKMRMK